MKHDSKHDKQVRIRKMSKQTLNS